MPQRIRGYGAGLEPARQDLPGPGATPDAFGANVGASAQQLGQAAQLLGVRIAEHREKEDRLTAASTAARMAADWEIEYQNLIRTAPAGARDFTRTVTEAYDRFLERRRIELTDSQYALSRPLFERARAMAVVRASQHEAAASAGHNRLLAERGLAATINHVATNPGAFDSAVGTGNALIDALNLPNNMREELRTNHLSLLTRAAFEARIYAARTPQELDTVIADLARPEWRERATPAHYDHLLDAARTFRRTLASGRDSVARAAVDHLRDRMTATGANRVEIDPTEIARADEIVRNSADPGVQWNWAQLRARYDAGRVGLRASPDAISDAVNSTRARIGLSADVQGAIEEASRATGGRVSASFLSQLAGTQSREYFDSLRNRTDYTLQPAHSGVNIADLSRELQEAGRLASEYFGARLRITSGHRSPLYNRQVGGASDSHHIGGNAIDIDITGMDAATRGRLVDSLVRAGFTGFGQYGTHLHADIRPNVPGAFGNRPGWGGWTNLDPEIVAVLERRGFRAGRPSGEIDRTGPAGQPATALPERGVFQFDDRTWFDLVARHGRAVGVPLTEATTPEEMLRFRQDPRIAAQMAAIYANENREQLRAGLGRDVSDAELGIAHTLGPANALILLRAFQDNPAASARTVLPQAAEARPDLFAGVNGNPPTVGDVYNRFMQGYVGGVSALNHARLEELNRVRTEMEAARSNGDIMTFGARAGRITLSQLDSDDALVNRGRQALEMQTFYRLEHPRPLTTEEVDRFTAVIQNGTTTDVQGLLARLQRLGPAAATGAFRQLGAQNGVFAHVAGMIAADSTAATAGHDVLRGVVRLRDNPDLRNVLGTASGGTDNQFNLIVGQALDGADPRARQAMRLAADALYAQRYGTTDRAFDPRHYREAVLAVLNSQVGSVNGVSTVLPRGITASEFDSALNGLTPQELIGLSVDSQPPRQSDGRIVTPVDIAYRGRFQAIGADTYRIVMDDGRPLAGARGREYRITLTPDTIRRLLRTPRETYPGIFEGTP